MNIRKLHKHKSIFEDKIANIGARVGKRWEELIGPSCGYYEDWGINAKDAVVVSYEHKGSNGTDVIPVRFFEMENTEEAKKEFDLYIKRKKAYTAAKEEAKKKEERLTLYKKLKKEFEKRGWDTKRLYDQEW